MLRRLVSPCLRTNRGVGWAFTSVALCQKTTRYFDGYDLFQTALVAGLVMRFVIFPAGVLSDIHHLARIGALVVGVAGYFVFGRNLGAGVLVSCVALVGLAYVL